MSMTLTSSRLIESIERRAAMPKNQSTFEAEDFLEFANEELVLELVPWLMSVKEDYLLYEDIVPTQNNVASYEIPSRALGNKLRDVQISTDNGNITELTRIGIGERFYDWDATSSTNLRKYYVQNNKVVFPGNGSGISGNLRFIYYIRPSALVLEENIGVITGIADLNNGTTKISLSSLPDSFNTSIKYDFYKGESPFTILNIDFTADAIDPDQNTVTFTNDKIPAELKIGDHLAQAGQCSIPQVPLELHPMLAQLVACRCLEAQGDTQGLQNALIKLQQMKTAAGMLVDSRVDDSPEKIVNRHGLTRTSIFSKRFNRN